MEAVAQAGTSSHQAAAHSHAASRAEKHGKDKRYFDLMAYIVSNTISGEIMAVENYSEMVPLMGSTDAKIETVKQANEESKHIKMLASLGKRLDYPVKTEIVEPQWRAIRGHFSAAVKKKDLAACLIIGGTIVAPAQTETSTSPVEIKLTAKKFEFEPSLIAVRKGKPVRLLITALDVEHGFEI